MGAHPGQTDSPAGHVRLRYWASARDAAGVAEEVLDVAGTVSLADVRRRAKLLHAGSARFAAVLDACSTLVGDRPVASADPETVRVEPGETVEFLPPFAGG
jgi:molybdopterin synthase sulfur carrier subunit